MKRESVSSPGMNSIGWENNTMEIEFRNGNVNTYNNVAFSEYCGFLSRASLGASLQHFLQRHSSNEE